MAESPRPDPDLNPPPVTAPEPRGRGIGAVLVLIFGLAIIAASAVILVLRLTRPADAVPPPDSDDTLGLILAILSGSVWCASGIVWWRRQLGLTIVGSIVALILGLLSVLLMR